MGETFCDLDGVRTRDLLREREMSCPLLYEAIIQYLPPRPRR
jgi:hypothetical protein